MLSAVCLAERVPTEDDQNVTFVVTLMATAFFDVPPSVSADGILSFKLGPGSFGRALFLVQLQVFLLSAAACACALFGENKRVSGWTLATLTVQETGRRRQAEWRGRYLNDPLRIPRGAIPQYSDIRNATRVRDARSIWASRGEPLCRAHFCRPSPRVSAGG